MNRPYTSAFDDGRTEPAPDLSPYEAVRKVGAGSQGSVWAVRNRYENVRGKLEAAKILRRGSPEIDSVELVRSNLKINDHEHLVPILTKGLEWGGEDRWYYVMPLADCLKNQKFSRFSLPADYEPRTLGGYLAQAGKPGLPFREVLEIGIELLLGLGKLHHQGIVHQDLKPTSVLSIEQKWRVGDYGCAILESAPHLRGGTHWFRPPERTPSVMGDTYAVGKVLFLLATGEKAPRNEHERDPWEICAKCGWETFCPKEDGQDRCGFRDLLLRACDSDPRARWTAQQMQAQISTLLAASDPMSLFEFVYPDYDFSQLTEQQRLQLLGLLERCRKTVTPRSQGFYSGSVVLRLELTRPEAEYLKAMFEAGEFASFGIGGVRLVARTPDSVRPLQDLPPVVKPAVVVAVAPRHPDWPEKRERWMQTVLSDEVWRTVRHVARGRDSAEDAIQEALCRAMELDAGDAPDDYPAFCSWVIRAAQLYLMNQFKRTQRERLCAVGLFDPVLDHPVPSFHEEAVDLQSMFDHLRRCCTDDEWAAFSGCWLEGKHSEEIAVEMGLRGVAAVRKLEARARKYLHGLLFD